MAALQTLEGKFRLERLNLENSEKARRKADERRLQEAAAEDARAQRKMDHSMVKMSENVTGHGVKATGTSATAWQAPKRAGIQEEQVEASAGALGDSKTSLLRLLWLDAEKEPLRAIILAPEGLKLFSRLLDAVSKRDKVNLVFWEQVQTVKAISDNAQRKAEALKLHNAHWAVATAAQANPVDGDEAETLLDNKAERVLAQLQAKWLSIFVHSERGKELVALVKSDTTFKFSTLPSLELDRFAPMLAQATRGIPFAICVADMYQPGARLISVNPAFETLTGYPEEECLGRNCRFLQGEETEQDAVLQLVEALRAAEPVQLEMTNYKKDGTRFRNLLSLQPVHDSRGTYRYCIGVLADEYHLSGADHESLARLLRVLPRRFEDSDPDALSQSFRQSGSSPQSFRDSVKRSRRRTSVEYASRDFAIFALPPSNVEENYSYNERSMRIAKLQLLEDPVRSANTIVASAAAVVAFKAHLGETPAAAM